MTCRFQIPNAIIAAFAIFCAFSPACEADTYMKYGDMPLVYDLSPAEGVGWNQTIGVQGVTISALLGGLGILPESTSPMSATAYLTTSIGPGTTVSDLIASSTFAVPSYAVQPDPASYALFSNINLAPGNYYLTIATPDVHRLGWLSSTTPALFTAPGFSYLGAQWVSVFDDVASYPPNANFVPLPESLSPSAYGLMFDISTDPGSAIPPNDPGAIAPEPAEYGLMSLGVAGLFLIVRRTRRSLEKLGTR